MAAEHEFDADEMDPQSAICIALPSDRQLPSSICISQCRQEARCTRDTIDDYISRAKNPCSRKDFSLNNWD